MAKPDRLVPITIDYNGPITGQDIVKARGWKRFIGKVPLSGISFRDCSHSVKTVDDPDYDLIGTCEFSPDGFPHYEPCQPGIYWCKPSLFKQAESEAEFETLKVKFTPPPESPGR